MLTSVIFIFLFWSIMNAISSDDQFSSKISSVLIQVTVKYFFSWMVDFCFNFIYIDILYFMFNIIIINGILKYIFLHSIHFLLFRPYIISFIHSLLFRPYIISLISFFITFSFITIKYRNGLDLKTFTNSANI